MKGAIFDMDGLLLDTERIFQQTWRELAAEHGTALDKSFTGEISGSSREEAVEVLRRYFPAGTDPSALHNECVRRVGEKECSGVPVKPGAAELLEGLRALGYRCAVASSSRGEMVRRNLRLAGLAELFDVIVSGEQVVRGKPAPDIFLLAAERLGLPPEACWVFEDSHNGIRAGHAAGCRAVMIPDMIPPRPDILPLCRVLPDLGTAWQEIREWRL